MNQKLLTVLLRKNVDDLKIIADDFVESGETPAAIVLLAQRKTEDIQIIISQLIPQEENDEFVSTTEIEQEMAEEQIPDEVVEFQDIEEEIQENENNDVESEIEEEQITEEEFQTDEVPENEDDNNMEPEVEEDEIIIEIEEETETEDETEETNEVEEVEENTVAEEIIEVEEVVTTTITTDDIIVEVEQTVEIEQIIETENTVETPETVKIEEKSAIVTIADKMGQTLTASRHESLYTSDNSLGNTLANKKVDDIKQAISIGDRFRFQRELFANNGEDLNKTINYINQLATFDEAVTFLKAKYKWSDDNETANDFLNIVKRKF